MYQWRMASCALIILGLAGCGLTKPTVVVQTVWPQLPDMPPLPPIELKPLQFSLPHANDSFVSLNYQNWLNLQVNQNEFKNRELLFNQRMQDVNTQRAEWRKLNEDKNGKSDPPR